MSLLQLTAMARLRVKTAGASGSFVGLAELPRSTPSFTYSPPTGGTLHQPADAAALATILANPNTTLQLGDIIELTAGVQYTGAGQTQQTFPAVTTQRGGTSAAKIYVRTSGLASLPAAGTRVGGSITTVAGMATLKGYMPLFRQITGGGTPPFKFANGATDYVFSGIAVDGGSVTTTSRLIEFGPQGATLAQMVQRIVFERCYVASEVTTNNCTRPIYFMGVGADCIVRDSWVYNAPAASLESQGILVGRNNTGPCLIENNFISGRVEGMLFGGDGPAADTSAIMPSDFTIRRNYFYQDPLVAVASKNIFELKCGIRILFEDNYGDTFIGGGQAHAINLKSVNQTGSDNSVEVRDVVMRYNRWKDLVGWFKVTPGQNESGGSYVPLSRVTAQHNLVEGLAEYGAIAGQSLMIQGVNDIQALNNTIMADAETPSGVMWYPGSASDNATGLVARDNIFQLGQYGIKGDSLGSGTASLDACYVGWVVAGNAMVGSATGYPAGNTYPATVAACGFTNAATRDYSLTAGSALKGVGYAGGDPGCDVATVLARTAGCISGDWS